MSNAHVRIGDDIYAHGDVCETPGGPDLLEISNLTLSGSSEISNVRVTLSALAGVLAQRYSVPPVGLEAELFVNNNLIFTGTVIDAQLTENKLRLRLAL